MFVLRALQDSTVDLPSMSVGHRRVEMVRHVLLYRMQTTVALVPQATVERTATQTSMNVPLILVKTVEHVKMQ